MCEAFGWESGINKQIKEAPQFYSILLFLIAVAAAIVMLPGLSLIQIMLTSQVINGIILPVILIAMLKIINNKRIMGSYVNSKLYNYISWFSIIILIGLTVLMVFTTIFPSII
jgi:Mn2+/Fe2+ NRAMP family transporter